LRRILLLIAVPAFVVLAPVVHADGVTLVGDVTREPNAGEGPSSDECAMVLFVGDLGAEVGIGCSNSSGTSGGPTAVAVWYDSPLPTPFIISSHYYHVFTQVSPAMSALTFRVWSGGEVPGSPIGSFTGLDFSAGNHTVAIEPAIEVHEAQFYYGQVQPQDSVGMRWGLDTSSESAGASFVLAPTCGLDSWHTVDSVGFPGNWVMTVSLETCGYPPVELTSWGEVKALYQ